MGGAHCTEIDFALSLSKSVRGSPGPIMNPSIGTQWSLRNERKKLDKKKMKKKMISIFIFFKIFFSIFRDHCTPLRAYKWV